jgi:hypothetical protein
MCSSGSKTKTSTSSTTALPQYANAYSSLLSQAQNVAQTPWNPATGQSVAGFSAPQNQAFDATQTNLGSYQPALTAANSNAAYGSAPISASAIQHYMDPYTQNVVNATQAQFANQNAQQLQDVNANAAKIGALTGDRSQVARSITQNQQNLAQNPIIAGLYSQGYQQALGAAQGDANRALQGAQIQSNLAGQTQQLGQNDINSLWGIGSAQQTQQQNVLNANSANAQAQSQYPFATTQWLASLATNLGGAAGTNSSQTQPGPNMWSQVAGLGLGALSLFNRGGRVGYDSGGVVLPYEGASSYVPSGGMMHGGQNHPGSMPSLGDNTQSSGMSDVLNNFKQAKSAFQGLGNLGTKAWNSANTTTDPNSGWSTTTTPSGLSGFGNYLGNMFGFADGGSVRRGYEDGGDVIDLKDDGTGTFAPSGLMSAGLGLRGSLASNDDVPFGDWNQPSPIGTEESPWATTVASAGDVAPPMHLGAPAPVEAVPAPSAPMATGYTLPESKGLFGLSLSDPVRQGLLAAGLGMMASDSPFIGTAIGQGGLAGIRQYGNSKQQASENAQAKTKIDMEAQRLSQAAKEAAERMRINSAQEARAAESFPLDQQTKELALKTAQAPKWQAIGTDEFGRTKYAFVNPLTQTVETAPGTAPAATAAENGTVDAAGNPLTGDEYLKTLPTNEATMIKKMVDGEIPPPSSYVLARSPYWNALMMKAAQYDPSFDQTSWGARSAGRKDFYGGGKSAEMVRAANQTIDHVGHLVESFDKLGNTQFPLYNAGANYVKKELTGKAGVPDFLANAHAVADEMSKVFKGSNLSDTEIKAWEHSLSPNMSPEQQRAAVAKLMDLLGGSLNALEQKRESSLGPSLSKKMGPLLNAHSQDVLERVKTWTDGGEYAHAPTKTQGRLGEEPGPGAVAYLKAHPDLAPAFDKKFGKGAAAKALGDR